MEGGGIAAVLGEWVGNEGCCFLVVGGGITAVREYRGVGVLPPGGRKWSCSCAGVQGNGGAAPGGGGVGGEWGGAALWWKEEELQLCGSTGNGGATPWWWAEELQLCWGSGWEIGVLPPGGGRRNSSCARVQGSRGAALWWWDVELQLCWGSWAGNGAAAPWWRDVQLWLGRNGGLGGSEVEMRGPEGVREGPGGGSGSN